MPKQKDDAKEPVETTGSTFGPLGVAYGTAVPIEPIKLESNHQLTVKLVTDQLLAKIEALEARDAENQEKLRMLYEVADKGRVFNYESGRTKKQPAKVKLSVHGGGIVTAWQTVKDELIKHPTTGRTVGEQQEYEVVLAMPDGGTAKRSLHGYPAFSDARYNERVEAEVVARREDYKGNLTLDLRLEDGRELSIDARFAN